MNAEANIYYFSEDTVFALADERLLTTWLFSVMQQEGYTLNHLNIIFCSDRYLHKKNITYLDHDTLTDVLTFDYATVEKSIFADLYISVERVEENAACYQKIFDQELHLVMVHGLLHLLGYDDQSPSEKLSMQTKEVFYLAQLRFHP